MKREIHLAHEFVEFIPDVLEENTLYVSIAYATIVHKCCCGCGREVVTPLSPTDWKLIFDGRTITLEPSIGNWSFKCESHYWIRGSKVRWAGQWTKEEIAIGRKRDQNAKKRYFYTAETIIDSEEVSSPEELKNLHVKQRFWQTLRKWFLSRRSRV